MTSNNLRVIRSPEFLPEPLAAAARAYIQATADFVAPTITNELREQARGRVEALRAVMVPASDEAMTAWLKPIIGASLPGRPPLSEIGGWVSAVMDTCRDIPEIFWTAEKRREGFTTWTFNPPPGEIKQLLRAGPYIETLDLIFGLRAVSGENPSEI